MACAKLKPAQNKTKWNKNVLNLSILVDRLFGPLLERGLQQRVLQPQVGRQAEVEDHRLVKQQAGGQSFGLCIRLYGMVLVKPPEYLVRVRLLEPEPCGTAMETAEIKRNLQARV